MNDLTYEWLKKNGPYSSMGANINIPITSLEERIKLSVTKKKIFICNDKYYCPHKKFDFGNETYICGCKQHI